MVELKEQTTEGLETGSCPYVFLHCLMEQGVVGHVVHCLLLNTDTVNDMAARAETCSSRLRFLSGVQALEPPSPEGA